LAVDISHDRYGRRHRVHVLRGCRTR
jgi:hypothetical protein